VCDKALVQDLHCVFFFFSAAEKRRLNDYIGHYEGLAYSTQRLRDNHLRSKRSTVIDAQPPVHLRFSSHGRYELPLQQHNAKERLKTEK
jgi:hypothetical protein